MIAATIYGISRLNEIVSIANVKCDDIEHLETTDWKEELKAAVKPDRAKEIIRILISVGSSRGDK